MTWGQKEEGSGRGRSPVWTGAVLVVGGVPARWAAGNWLWDPDERRGTAAGASLLTLSTWGGVHGAREEGLGTG